ncbi:MAG: hypothetical protein A2W11_07410, partial [Ignavibacteria bacterium RBG_16_35_7]
AWENYVCRMDFRGNILWEKEVGFPNAQDYGGGVVRTSWNTYLLVGTTMGDTLPGYRNVAVRHIDADGNILFERYFTSGIWNEGGSVIETNDSCFVMLCYLGIPSTFNQAPGMIKIDRYGNEIWRHRQDSLDGYPLYIRQLPDSSFILLGAGAGVNNQGDGSCYYAKYKSDGTMDWIKYPFGLTDTIPNYPSALRGNEDGTFDIYYGTNYSITWGDPTVYGLYNHYDSVGTCLTTKKLYQPLGNVFINTPDSNLWAISTNYSLYILGDDSVFGKKVGFEGSDTTYKWVHNYIQTSDGGYLGIGAYSINQDLNTLFYIIKFSSDARYQPDQFSESVNAYPNPSTDGNVTLTFDMLKDDNVQVDIYTSEGKLIYTNSIFCPANSHTELPVRLYEISTNGGMYILQARTSDAVIRKRLVVMRQN